MKSKTLLTSIAAAALSMSSVFAQSNVPGVNPPSGVPSNQMPRVLSEVSFDQRLNEPLPLDLTFRDEEGRTVKLGDYYGTKPVVLTNPLP